MGEVNKQSSNRRVVLDPYVHIAGSAKESADVRQILAVWPVANLVDLGVVWGVAFIVTLVSKEGDFWYSDEQLLCGDGGASTMKMV